MIIIAVAKLNPNLSPFFFFGYHVAKALDETHRYFLDINESQWDEDHLRDSFRALCDKFQSREDWKPKDFLVFMRRVLTMEKVRRYRASLRF